MRGFRQSRVHRSKPYWITGVWTAAADSGLIPRRRPQTEGLGAEFLASDKRVTGAIAERYATALYELADGDKALDAVADDLTSLREIIAGSDDLLRMLRSPLLQRDEQAKAMTAILEKAGGSDLTRRLVGVVAENRRLFALPAIIDAFLRQLAERRGEVTAEVTSAVKLKDKQIEAVTDALKKSVGGKVAVDLKVDPALIGGLVVKVGSRMVDSSVRTKLQKLQLAMKGTG